MSNHLNRTPIWAGIAALLIIAAVAIFAGSATAQSSAIVDYDADDDGLIEVANLAQLNAIRWDLDGNGTVGSDHSSSYAAAFPNAVSGMGCPSSGCIGYELTADLDFDTNGNGAADAGDAYWNNGAGWEPIGRYQQAYPPRWDIQFQATFEGNGHAISNLMIDRSDSGGSGLFGSVAYDGAISNAGLVDVSVVGSGDDVGAVGGLAGVSSGTITASYVIGSVSGVDVVGGLVGSNGGPITASYFNGSVQGRDFVGGLAGLNDATLTVNYAAGSVSGNDYVGGLVGFHVDGNVSNSYSANSVSGDEVVGGLIGLFREGSVADSYSTGSVMGKSYLGGLIGWIAQMVGPSTQDFTDNYWDTETSGRSGSAAGVGKTTAELQSPTSNSGIYANWNSDAWDFGAGTQYPALKADLNGDGVATWQEFGQQRTDYDTDDDGLIEIANLAQLNTIRWDLDGNGTVGSNHSASYAAAFPNATDDMGCPASNCVGYELTAGLDFDTNGNGEADSGDVYWNDGAGWEPIGRYDQSYPPRWDIQFQATFEGNSHTISNLMIDRSDSGGLGLFGSVAYNGAISNVGLVDVNVVGSGDSNYGSAGGLAGDSSGTITASYVNGSVTGVDIVGGLVGSNGGPITASYFNGSVQGHNIFVGGLAGYSAGTLTANYAAGSVSGNAYVGGLVGVHAGGDVANSYATGSVSGNDVVGGLIGQFGEGSVTDSYSTGSVTGKRYVGGMIGGLSQSVGPITRDFTASYWDTQTSGRGGSSAGIGKTTAELQSPTSSAGIFADWNSETWDFGAGTQYPALKADLNGDGVATWQEFGVQRTDYDADDDGLIEVGNLAQFNAIRWDLDGDGTAGSDDSVSYQAAFNNQAHDMGCPASGCLGYELTADLDFDTDGDSRTDIAGDDYWNNGHGWEPIGTTQSYADSEFDAVFEGNNHTISNLFIKRPAGPIGLFGHVKSGSDIRRIGLLNAQVDGTGGYGGAFHVAGALVGRNYHGAISDSYAAGSVENGNFAGGLVGISEHGAISSSHAAVTVKGRNYVGGLVGRTYHGSISHSSATGSVEGVYDVGGLLGFGDSTSIDASYATGPVKSEDDNNVGGLLGRANNGAITDSYATGSVDGQDNVGGLVGFNDNGAIAASYATGSVDGFANAGGLTGLNDAGTIDASYATGSVAAEIHAGGLVGRDDSGTVTASYWNTDTSGQPSSAVGAGKTTAELQTPTSNSGLYATWDASRWDFGAAAQYPALKMDFNGDGAATWQEFGQQRADFDSDDDGLIEVANLAQLNAIRYDLDGDGAVADDDAGTYFAAFNNPSDAMGCPSDGCSGYELVANLNFDTNGDGRTDIAGDDYWNAGKGWNPIGTFQEYQETEFNAVFEGNQHIISNLYISRSDLESLGLFGDTESASEIRNLGLVDARVDDSGHGSGDNVATGSLVGDNRGAIDATHSTGLITADFTAGGLVGRNQGHITHSYSTATIRGFEWIGGLVGSNRHGSINSSYATGPASGTYSVGGLSGDNSYGTISNSYATGAAAGDRSVGGLTGSNFYATIDSSYSTGPATGNSKVGGLAGGQDNGVATHSYWDTDTSGRSSSAGGTGKTTAELQAPSNNSGIYSDWDADSWDFGGSTQYPALKADIDGDGFATWQEFGQQRTDYDSDDDGLIEVANLAQLNAIRYDQNGDGATDDPANLSVYSAVYPNPYGNMGCPASGCVGYELTVDLDFDTNGNGQADSGDVQWNGGAGWAPFGSYSGVLEGNGHAIDNLYINRSDRGRSGLFSRLNNGAQVRNLALTNVDITSNGDAGAFAGLTTRAAISNSYATGSVTVYSGNDSVGGLVGEASGHPSDQETIRDSYSLVNVRATAPDTRAGGLVGSMHVSQSSYTRIVNSFAAGLVLSYEAGRAGGLVGQTGIAQSRISDSYWDTQTTGWRTSADDGDNLADDGRGRTQAQLQAPTSGSGIYAAWNSAAWDFGNGSQYPALKYDTDGDGTATVAEFGAQPRAAVMLPVDLDTDDDGLIEVSNPTQLSAMRWDLDGDGLPASNGGDYRSAFTGSSAAWPVPCVAVMCRGYELTRDIDLDTQPWTPVGDAANHFNATFRGNGHTIIDLLVESDSTSDNYGLFGETGSDSLIEGVYLYSPRVVSYGGDPNNNEENNAGALVGMNRGIVREAGMSYVWGDDCVITAHNAAGGLVGGNKGIIERSWARCGWVKSSRAGGGLVGINHDGAMVKNSWADGLVVVNPTGWKKGALAGWNYGTIENSFSLGETRRGGQTRHGPFTGQQDGTVIRGFYVGHYDDRHFGGINRTDQQMRAPDANDLSFFSVWDLDLWDLGDSTEYSALRLDTNGDGLAAVWELGAQRPSAAISSKPVKAGDGNAATSRESFSVSFTVADGEGVKVDGVGYRIAAKGEACHEWFGGSRVPLGASDGRATLTEENGVYTLSIDRATSWAFRHGNRVCLDVSFLNSEGKGGPGRRWHAIQMPSQPPSVKPIMAGDAAVFDGSVTLAFLTDPYDWARGAGYRIAREGSACHNWTGGQGPFRPGDTIDGATLDKSGELWRLTLPVGEDETMRPNRKYCVDVTLFNDDDWAPNGRRWRFTTAN